MRNYESMIVLSPDLSPEEAKAKVDEIGQLIASRGGEFVRFEEWGLRDLAYPIQKKQKGYYFLLYFRAKGDFIKEYERNLELREDVLRYLTLRLEGEIPPESKKGKKR